MGTVTELSLVWNKLQTRVIDSRPLVLLGDCWPPVVEAWKTHLVVNEADISFLDFASTPDEAVTIIDQKARFVSV
jgi:predicted Rossmann-fold nucleotide-binding protein